MKANRKRSILIVDDSTALLETLTSAFEAAGYDVGYAVDGEEVFRKLTALAPQAILLDVYLPGIDGADVCRLLKSHPLWRQIPLLVMSARMSEHEERAFRQLGADGILCKPFDSKLALTAVAALITASERTPAGDR